MSTVTQNLFRSRQLREAPSSIDRDRGQILGAKIIEAGQVNDDRPWEIDAKALEQVVLYGNRPNRGIKARFTHPGLSDDGLGKYLGRWSNFRLDGDAVRADLQIAESASQSPNGDLREYVLTLAEEDPESFGVSIAFRLDWDEMDPELEEGELQAVRFSALYAADVVDEPAATRGGLFSWGGDQASIPAEAEELIDRYFADVPPAKLLERFAGFLTRYARRKGLDMPELSTAAPEVEEQETNVQTNEQQPESASEPQEQEDQEQPVVAAELSRDEAQQYIELFGDAGARWYLEGRPMLECVQEALASRDERIAELSKRLDAALSASGEEEPLDASPKPDGLNEKARVKYEALKKQGVDEATAKFAAMFEARREGLGQ